MLCIQCFALLVQGWHPACSPQADTPAAFSIYNLNENLKIPTAFYELNTKNITHIHPCFALSPLPLSHFLFSPSAEVSQNQMDDTTCPHSWAY